MDDLEPVREDERVQKILRHAADLRLGQLRTLAHELGQTGKPLHAQAHERFAQRPVRVRDRNGQIVEHGHGVAAVGHARLQTALVLQTDQACGVPGRHADALEHAAAPGAFLACERIDLGRR